ncbi:MAG: hypothetical protein LBV74_20590 [Tannerella sp.]|jgi:hypothetical protein|nr:hypothetical protein [Tannerella sp.]
MKTLKSILLCLLFATGLLSCGKDDLTDVKKLPIEKEIPIQFFNLDYIDSTNVNEIYITYFKAPHLINSEEDLSDLFNELKLDMPEDLKILDYEQYSLLLKFDLYISKAHSVSVRHYFYKNINQKNDYDYQYYQSIGYGSANVETENEPFYYSGILVDKISNNSKIQFSLASVQ